MKVIPSLCLVMLLLVSGYALADDFKHGKVTGIDRERQSIEIDGHRYYCLKGVMRHIHKGDKVEYIIDNNYDDAEHHTAVIEIYAQE